MTNLIHCRECQGYGSKGGKVCLNCYGSGMVDATVELLGDIERLLFSSKQSSPKKLQESKETTANERWKLFIIAIVLYVGFYSLPSIWGFVIQFWVYILPLAIIICGILLSQSNRKRSAIKIEKSLAEYAEKRPVKEVDQASADTTKVDPSNADKWISCRKEMTEQELFDELLLIMESKDSYIDSIEFSKGVLDPELIQSLIPESDSICKGAKEGHLAGLERLEVEPLRLILRELISKTKEIRVSLCIKSDPNYKGEILAKIKRDLITQVSLEDKIALGKIENPIDRFNSAVNQPPEDPAVYFERGLACLEQKQLREATDYFSTAITLNPNFAAAYRQRATVYHQRGLVALANNDRLKAEELEHENQTDTRAPAPIDKDWQTVSRQAAGRSEKANSDKSDSLYVAETGVKAVSLPAELPADMSKSSLSGGLNLGSAAAFSARLATLRKEFETSINEFDKQKQHHPKVSANPPVIGSLLGSDIMYLQTSVQRTFGHLSPEQLELMEQVLAAIPDEPVASYVECIKTLNFNEKLQFIRKTFNDRQDCPLLMFHVLRRLNCNHSTNYVIQWASFLTDLARALLQTTNDEKGRDQFLLELEVRLNEEAAGIPDISRCRHPAGHKLATKLSKAISNLVRCFYDSIPSEEILKPKDVDPLIFYCDQFLDFVCALISMDDDVVSSKLDLLYDLMPNRITEPDAPQKLIDRIAGNVAPEQVVSSFMKLAFVLDQSQDTDLVGQFRQLITEVSTEVQSCSSKSGPEMKAWLARLPHLLSDENIMSSLETSSDQEDLPSNNETQGSADLLDSPSAKEAGTKEPFNSMGVEQHQQSVCVPQQPVNPTNGSRTTDNILSDLNLLIGLKTVKDDVRTLANFVAVQQRRQRLNLPNEPVSRHLVFFGNPGTGKTTVARILSELYKSLGVLSSGHLVEVDRSTLVAGYMGQTAILVRKKVQAALGGVLFVDEAYSLSDDNSQGDYGKEAIDTLVKLMEDHRDDLVVIVAGYPAEMDKFIKSNPGLRSRFNTYFHFDDYHAEELLAIFELRCGDSYTLTAEARSAVRKLCERAYASRGPGYGNARDVRNWFQRIIANQANRVVYLGDDVDKDTIKLVCVEDVLPLLESAEDGPEAANDCLNSEDGNQLE